MRFTIVTRYISAAVVTQNYMDGDADRLYSEIEKDVMETIKEELKGELK